MAQTFTSWDKVPATIERKISLILVGSGTSTYKNGFDRNCDEVTIYSLSDYKVIFNMDFLTDAQKIKFFELAVSHNITLSELLHNLTFESETFRIGDVIFHLPGMIVGTWPHCKCYGCMDHDGRIHT